MPLLERFSLEKKFRSRSGTLEVLKGVTLTLDQPGIYGVIGLNGAGKTTLFRCLVGLLEPDNGTIYINKENITQGNIARYSRVLFEGSRAF